MARIRRVIRWSVYGVLTLMVLVVLIVETPWFRNWVRLQLVARTTAAIEGELRVGRLSGSLWTGVTLDDVELLDRSGHVLQASHIRVRYDPFLLARGRWVIDKVEIDGAKIRLTETPAGWNVTTLGRKRAAPGPPPKIVIHQIVLTNSEVAIDPIRAAERVLSGVSLEADFALSDGEAALDVESLVAHDSATGLTLREFTGEASHNFRVFNVSFLAESPTMRIAGAAAGSGDAAGRSITANVDVSRLDLAKLTGNPRLATDITGRLDSRIELGATGASEPRATFAFAGTTTRAFGYAAERLSATGTFAAGVVRFDAEAVAYAARARVQGDIRLPSDQRALAFTGRGTVSGVDLRRLPASLQAPRLATRIAGTFAVNATGRDWYARATLADSIVEGATLVRGTDVLARASGGVTTFGAVGMVRHLDLQRLGRALPVPALQPDRYASDMSGGFFVGGRASSFRPLELTGGISMADSTISATRLPRFDALVHFSERRLTAFANGTFSELNDTTLGTPDRAIQASGVVNGWLVIPDTSRPITEDNLETSARISLDASKIRDFAIEAAYVRADLIDGVLTLHDVDVRAAEATVQAAGALAIDESGPPPQPGIKLTGTLLDPTFIERLTGEAIVAAGALEATVTGSVRSPAAAGMLTLYRVGYRDAASALTLTSSFNVDFPDRDVTRLDWKTDTAATFVKLGTTEIQRLTATANGGPREMAVNLQLEQQRRSVGLEGRLTLLPESQELRLSRLALTTADVAWSLPAGQSASVRYAAERVDVTDFTLVRGTQQLVIGGGFNLGDAPTPGDRGLRIEAREVEVADINQALLGTRQLTGRVNGTVTISGTKSAPVAAADLVIRDGTVEGVAYQVFQARGQYAARTATLDVLLQQSAEASVRAAGTVPIGSEGAGAAGMDVRITGGPVSLGLAQALTPEITKVTGEASFDLRLTGTLEKPLINGTASVTKGAFDLTATGSTYSALEATVEFTGAHMDIRNFQIADANGDLLTATGGLDVIGALAGRSVNIDVRGSNFTVLNNTFGTADIDINVRVSGEIGAPVVRGTLTLDSGRLEVATILERTTSTPYSTEAQAAPGAEKPAPLVETPLSRADIQLQIQLPDNLVLRGRGLRVSNSSFGIGDMNIVTGGTFDLVRRPGGDVEVTGALEVVRGTYTFQGRRFDIERGSDVRFRGGPLSDPVLNVNATREVSGITAEVRIRGTAQAPQLTLGSRPPLDEGEILSLIVFNQPINSLAAEQRTNLGERAAVMAAGAVTTPLSDSIARALNLDLFEIQVPTSDAAGSVTVGGQLGSRIFVGLKQQFGRGDASLLTLEYRISEVLRFVTSIARGTLQAHATRRMDRGGVDLIFVIRY